jgi:hypothetical protein
MKRVILVLGLSFLMSLHLRCQDKSFSIRLEIDKVYYGLSSDVLIDGVFIFENKYEKKIILPRSFDLDVHIYDQNNNPQPINRDIALEYVNLIKSKKRIRVKPNSSIRIHFTEWRLFAYSLKIGEKYYFQYSLKTGFYPKLEKYLGQRTIMTDRKLTQIPTI